MEGGGEGVEGGVGRVLRVEGGKGEVLRVG